MKDHVGKLAGQVWRFLGEAEVAELGQLSRKMKLKAQDAYQGLGWLAREGKVEYHRKGETVLVSLSDQEKAAFRRHPTTPTE